MPVAISLSFTPDPMANTTPTLFGHKRPRPQGLWKVRASGTPRLAAKIDKQLREQRIDLAVINAANTANDDGNDSDTYSYSSSHKRRRLSPGSDTTSSDGESEIYYWDTVRQCMPERPPQKQNRIKKMMNSTTTAAGAITEERTKCDLEDWEDLKELFAKAQEHFESMLQ